MNRRMFILLGLSAMLAAGLLWLPGVRERIDEHWRGRPSLPNQPKPDPEKYAAIKSDLARWREDLSKRHQTARTAEAKRAIEDDARIILERQLPAMMRCWLGTRWDYNGTSTTPGEGRIACGYYVSTVLHDAGFRFSRVSLAQQPSSRILRTFVPKGDCALKVDQPYPTYADALQQSEPGIYLVGLDTHVGFIEVRDGAFHFIHSSGCSPWRVVDEVREDAGALIRSRWRMTANLTANRSLILRWLRGEKLDIPTD